MKQFLLIIAMAVSPQLFGQGVITIKNLRQAYPFGQLFNVDKRQLRNYAFLYDYDTYVNYYLDSILVQYKGTIEEGTLLDDGDLEYYLDSGNGYGCTITYRRYDDETSMLRIWTYAIIEE